MTPDDTAQVGRSDWRSVLTRPLSEGARQRLQVHLWLLPVYLWLAFAWAAYAADIGTAGRLDRSGHIKGHDFAHFYVLGQIVNDGAPDELYSFDAQAKRMDALVPEYENRFLPVYGPQVAMFFAPLARLPYVTAVGCWLLATVLIYAACCYAMWSTLPLLRRHAVTTAVLCAGFPPFYSLVASGHISVFALGLCTAALIALRRGRPLVAGFLLGSLFFKPALGLALPFVFLFSRSWRLMVGAAAAVLLQLAVPTFVYGPGVLWSYWNAITHLGEAAALLEPQPYQMHSLRSFFSILLPWSNVALGAYAIAAVFVAWRAAAAWKADAPVESRYAALLLAMVLINPHVNAYDLVILVPALMVAASMAIAAKSKRLATLVYACYALPAVPQITALLRVQFTVPVMVALMWYLSPRSSSKYDKHRDEDRSAKYDEHILRPHR